MKYLLKISILCAFFLTFSCDSDNDSLTVIQGTEAPDNFSDYFGNETAHSFIGRIIDSNDNPIEGVVISIGTSTANTDENGVFIIKDASVHERFAYIKAEKNGYITGSRALTPTDGMNNITIMLLEETIAGTVTSGTEQTVSLSNGASVKLPGNYIKEDGSVYEGSVNVVMHHLDPESEDLSLQMPGMLYGQNEDGAERFLQSFGMLTVELIGSGNEKLNLAEGSTAEIRMPLSPAMAAQANGTIPLWHFDDDKGYWIEEGEATLQGNEYVGSVSHFSFWNCDVPTTAVNLCITVLDQNGQPIQWTGVKLESENFGSTGGLTNGIGKECGMVPANEILEFTIIKNYLEICEADGSIFTESIGPFTTDTEIIFNVDTSGPDVIEYNISGQLQSCDGQNIENGYAYVRSNDNITIIPLENDSFDYYFLTCPAENHFTVKGYNYDDLQTTNEFTVSLTPDNQSIDLGILQACNNVEEYISYQVDGGDVQVLFEGILAEYSPDGNVLEWIGDDTNLPTVNIIGGGICFYLYGRLNATSDLGEYDNILDFDDINDTGFSFYECFNQNDITYNLISLGEVGEYIDISFSGDFTSYNSIGQQEVHTITGTIHVIRDE